MSSVPAVQILRDLPGLSHVDHVEPLPGGRSPDDVFLVIEPRGARRVLRLSDPTQLQRKQAEAQLLRALRAQGLSCPEAIHVGVIPELEKCYTLSGYIEGSPGKEVIRDLSPDQQARAGWHAGAELRIVHSQRPPLPKRDWQLRRRRKHERIVQALAQRSLRFDGQEKVDAFVEAGWALLEASPFRLQHDDFQLGNIIIAHGQYAGVIDFANWDGGDPIEDFYKVPWLTSRFSRAFARGQVAGYLAEGEPANFWQRYNLFVALSLYSSLLWAAKTGDALETFRTSADPLGSWRAGIAHLIETHDFVTGTPPAWHAETHRSG